MIEDLLDAYDQNDEEQLQAALRRNCLLSLDWEYVTVIKNVLATSGKGAKDNSTMTTISERQLDDIFDMNLYV